MKLLPWQALEELEALRLAEAAQRDAKDAALARAEKLERESSSRGQVEGPGTFGFRQTNPEEVVEAFWFLRVSSC